MVTHTASKFDIVSLVYLIPFSPVAVDHYIQLKVVFDFVAYVWLSQTDNAYRKKTCIGKASDQLLR